MTFGGPEMIIVLVLVLVLFGGSQLPKLAKNLGKAQKEFKDGIGEANKSDADTAKSDTDTAEPAKADPAVEAASKKSDDSN
jgi:sec-independent protein translocase protein TatA